MRLLSVFFFSKRPRTRRSLPQVSVLQCRSRLLTVPMKTTVVPPQTTACIEFFLGLTEQTRVESLTGPPRPPARDVVRKGQESGVRVVQWFFFGGVFFSFWLMLIMGSLVPGSITPTPTRSTTRGKRRGTGHSCLHVHAARISRREKIPHMMTGLAMHHDGL
ncbi:hypothetical protein LY76DRAFT_56019 [Colletotrichum caudatum]|nr:hypothetical protein LY76DRAFT_56019 [Colletotrichum caudatum]